MRILISEDEPQLARHVTSALSRQGHQVNSAADGPGGLQAALTDPPDLIVLDVNLPGLDGFAVLARLRAEQSSARVLMLTARGELSDKVRGLKAGADDYIAKPFAMEELVARVEALGRRASSPMPGGRLQVAGLHMDLAQRRVTRGGQAVALSPREFDLLQVLMQEPGRYFGRTELHDRVWQSESNYDSRTVEMFIARLRRKLDADSATPFIHNIRNVGYAILTDLPPEPKP